MIFRLFCHCSFLPMVPPLLFVQWFCNCSCWCHHPFATRYTMVPHCCCFLSLSLLLVDCLFVVCCSHCCCSFIFCCCTCCLWCCHCLAVSTFSMRHGVADTTAVAACGYQHHCCWLPVDCCFFLVVTPSPCKCCSLCLLCCCHLKASCCSCHLKASCCNHHLLFLLPFLLLLVDTLSLFLLCCCTRTVLPMCKSVLSCCPFFCLLYHYSDGHAFAAVARNHRWLIVCNCSCCAGAAIAVTVLQQLQHSL